MLGSVRYPFPETTDFSALLIRAQASGAKVLGLANAGGDTENCIKQAQEFGLMRKMKVAAMLIQSARRARAGAADGAGAAADSESYYWDLNDRTRAWNNRIKGKTPNGIWPNMTQAGDYARDAALPEGGERHGRGGGEGRRARGGGADEGDADRR